MNHINEILQLLDNIIVCGENMAKLGTLLKESLPEFDGAVSQKDQKGDTRQAASKKSAPAEAPKKTEEPAAPAYTFADVRKAFSAKSHAGYTSQVKELISKYGADRLTDVKEADYPTLMADLEVIG